MADHDRAVAPIRREARRHHLSPSEVDDVVQEALYQAWLKWSEYDQTRPIGPWLCGFGRKAILTKRIAKSTSRVLDGIEAAGISGLCEPSPAECAEVKESRDRVRGLVARAPSSYREVLRMLYWEELRISEVADRLGQSPKAIRRRLKRALRWLNVEWRGVRLQSDAGGASKKSRNPRLETLRRLDR